MVLRYLETVILVYAYQLRFTSVLQVHIIDSVFQEKVQMLLSVLVQQLIHLVFQHRITLGIGNINFFLYGIEGIVIA